MQSKAKIRRTFTPEEYLELERQSSERHEFLDGEIFQMAGESLSHSRVCVNLTIEVGFQLRGKQCEALSSNMKVRTSTASLFSYPDLTIVCGEPIFHDLKKDVVVNPRVIFEVLSPSTEKYDRAKKFQRYRLGNETFTDYVLISQETALVEHFHKNENGSWTYENYNEMTDVLRLDEIELELVLEKLYDRVEIAPLPEEENER
ncbi:MAG TPA: Uma2 family endonuclease [Pyrinomonadaceae bacterium]|nr:Uma2 family endonuclease [Pyrinomonadaceae bacterium]